MAFKVCDSKIAEFEEYADAQVLAAAHDAGSRPALGCSAHEAG